MKGKGMNSMMKYMMMSEMMKGKSDAMSNMLPMMFLMGNGGGAMDNMFEGMFDLGMDDVETETEEKE